jgi:large subunit ribosomal protein L25
MERVKLTVEARKAGKSSSARALRRQGLIPGIFYGNGRTPEAVVVHLHDMRTALTGEGGRHAILDVISPGAKSATPAIVKDMQVHPVRDTLMHFDLLEIRMDRAIDSATRVVLVGESPGVEEGGVLDQPTHELAISALPTALPESIEVDVSSLGIGDSVKLADITPPEGVTFTGDPDIVLASVVAPTQLTEAEEAGLIEGEELEGEEGEEGEAAAEREGGEEQPAAEREGDSEGE